MSLGDLTAQHEPDAAAALLGGEERHEEVLGVGDPRAAVADHGLEARGIQLPGDRHFAIGLHGCFDGVLHQVDEQLLDLVTVGLDRAFGTGLDLDRAPGLEGDDTPDERRDRQRL